MAELWPFIPVGMKKWLLQGRNFISERFFSEFEDGWLLSKKVGKHSKGNFMVRNNILKVSL